MKYLELHRIQSIIALRSGTFIAYEKDIFISF